MVDSLAKISLWREVVWRLARWVAAICLLVLAAWSELAVLMQAPLATQGRVLLATLFAAVFIATAASLLLNRWLKWTLPAAVAMALTLGIWWSSIEPSDRRNWQAESSRRALITIAGDDVEVRNVRSFIWTGPDQATARWEDRLYSLSDLRALDLYTSTWGNENIAHALVSFVFGSGPPLAISLEIRREVGEDYSPIAGFFKRYELAPIAADESDIVKVRTNFRNEIAHRYRIDVKPENAAKLLLEYAALTQDLEREPRFYHTIWTNCTTAVYAMLRRISPADFPTDYRVLLSGRLPDYLYDIGFLDRSLPLEEIKRRADITMRARLAAHDPDFSAAIRR